MLRAAAVQTRAASGMSADWEEALNPAFERKARMQLRTHTRWFPAAREAITNAAKGKRNKNILIRPDDIQAISSNTFSQK